MVAKCVVLVCATILMACCVGWASEALTFTGTVVDGEGKPMAGAQVTAYAVTDTFSLLRPEPVAQGVTDPEGKFTFEVDLVGGGGLHFVASREGASIGLTWWHPELARRLPGNPTELGIRLTTPAILSGVVTDETGAPISGAKVEACVASECFLSPYGPLCRSPLNELTTTTDASGRFTFTDIPVDATADFVVSAPGRAKVTTFGSSEDGSRSFAAGRTDIRVVLLPEARIEGVVVSKDTRAPVAGVPLALTPDSDYAWPERTAAVSDANGAFVVGGLGAGSYAIGTKHPSPDGLAEWAAKPTEVELRAGEHLRNVTVEVVRGGVLEIHVTSSPGGKPVADASATVLVNPEESASDQFWVCTTDQRGIGRLRLVAGAYAVSMVSAHGYDIPPPGLRHFALAEGQVHRMEVVLLRLREMNLRGTVRDGDGKPVAGAEISAVAELKFFDLVTDENGEFSVTYHLPHRWARPWVLLLVRHPGLNLATVKRSQDCSKPLDVTVEPAAILVGTVTDPAGRPISGANIHPVRDSDPFKGPFGAEAETDAGGRYEIRAVLLKSRYRLYANREGYGSATVEIIVDGEPGGAVEVDEMTLHPAYRVRSPGQHTPTDAAEGADAITFVPEGFRVFPGTDAEPYMNTGWAKEVIHEGTGIEMVFIPACEFDRGIRSRGPNRDDSDESPRHTVCVPQPYYVGRYEVTQEQWKLVMGRNPSNFEGEGCPVDSVSWDDCQIFLRRAGWGLRLPTEAEWEYACYAGTTAESSFGDIRQQLGKYAWTYEPGRDGKTHPVGLKLPNPWGLYDMHGNAREWCQDFAGSYGISPRDDPQGPSSTTAYAAQRGGATGRWGGATWLRRAYTGFRVWWSSPPNGSHEGPKEDVSPEFLVPYGFRAAPDAGPEPYTNTGWANEVIHKHSGIEMVFIPAGEFQMGSPSSEYGRKDDEGPVHTVRITKPFYMGKYEVSWAWEKCISGTPSLFKKGRRRYVSASWNDCQAFMRHSEWGLRLPTEAEWEYACRAGTTTPFHCGETISTSQTNGSGPAGVNGPRTAEAGSVPPNAWGLYDMHGNASEWCQDFYDEGYYSASPSDDPQGPSIGARRVVRGGFWKDETASCRSASRMGIVPSKRSAATGFRACWWSPLFTAMSEEPGKAASAECFVPEGFRAAPGSGPEPYTNTGWTYEVIHEETGIEMVFIPAGEFQMGSASMPQDWAEGGLSYIRHSYEHYEAEEPPHVVGITKPFYMGKYEVTQEQWQRVISSNPSHFKGSEKPVDSVSWNNCQEFCKMAGWGLRLPTEAEWEYACRAGTNTPFFFGVHGFDLRSHAWYAMDGRDYTHVVGLKDPNPWGLYDVYGNVSEWCQDFYDYGYYAIGPRDDPPGPSSGTRRVQRGGNREHVDDDCRSARRAAYRPEATADTFGFRVCWSEPAP